MDSRLSELYNALLEVRDMYLEGRQSEIYLEPAPLKSQLEEEFELNVRKMLGQMADLMAEENE